jgi:hypothetical protein
MALAASVIAPISALTASLFGAPEWSAPAITPDSTPTGSLPAPAPEPGDPTPSPRTPEDRTNVAAGGPEASGTSGGGGVSWAAGLAVILLCGAAGVMGYSVATRKA